LQPIPGFETLLVVQAIPGDNAPAFYSVEWSKSENAIVRALRPSGEQVWMTHLSSSGNPSTLKHSLPLTGEVFENGMLVSDQSLFIIGVKKAFTITAPVDPSALGLPPDGKSFLVHATGDAVGGILLLERGRFRDSLVDLNPADGSEFWRYRSAGRLATDWTANWNMDVEACVFRAPDSQRRDRTGPFPDTLPRVIEHDRWIPVHRSATQHFEKPESVTCGFRPYLQ
jgi:hypothetical protein